MTTSNTRNLCQSCGNPYTLGTKYCEKCGNPVTAEDKTTIPLQPKTPIPPPPPPQPLAMPPVPPMQPIATRRTFQTKGKIIALSALILLVLLLIGGGLFSVAYQLGRNSVQGEVTLLSTATTASGTTPTLAPTATLTNNPTATVIPSPTPTANLKTINKDLKIPFTGSTSPVGGSYPKLDVMLNNIVIDSINNDMLWTFTISNQGTQACTNIGFTAIQLEDPNANIYMGQGQASDQWSIGIGKSVQTSPMFSFLPTPGVRYTLTINISIQGCGMVGTSASNAYQTESFTF